MRIKLLRLIMVAIATTSSFSVWAKPRSLEQARAIAARHAREMGIVQSSQGAPRKVKSQVNRASTSAQSYYIFENEGNKGYTIVSGDDRLPDIVGYSCNGSYQEANQPEAFREYMKVFAQLTEQLERGDSTAIKQAQELKERQRSSAETKRIKVSPLLGKIEWNQYAPYNEQCPKNGSRRCLTGCSPTAMAQILAYYRYPTSMLKDTPAYTASIDGYTTKVPSRSKGKPYDWDAMLPSYKGQYTQRQADAVAQLMADCGAAMGALYTPEATGASVSVEVFRDYFGYDGDLLQFLKHSSFTHAEWEVIIDRELLASRPICYAGVYSDGIGHAFVCDGADGNGFYHINWGWDGAYNGYFDLSVLNYDHPGPVNSSIDDGYNRGQTMLLGIAPDNGKSDIPLNIVPGTVTVSPEISVEGIVSFGSSYFFIRINFVVPPKLDVYLAMGIKDENGGYKVLTNGMHYDATKIETYSTVRYEEDKDVDLPQGKVDVVPIYSTDGKNWQPCSGREDQTHFRYMVTGSTVERVFPTLSAKITEGKVLRSHQENVMSFKFYNEGDADVYTSLPMAITKTKEKPNKYDRTVTVIASAHSLVEKRITLDPMSAGTYYVWLKNEGKSSWFAEQFKNSFCMEAQPIIVVDNPLLVDAGTNKAEGETETSNAYYTIDLVDAPLTHEDNAKFYFTLRNIGGDCDATVKAFMSIWRGYNDMDSSYTAEKQVTLVGNGAETKVVFETDADSSAEKGYFALCQLQNIDVSGVVFQLKNKDTLPSNYLYILPKRRMYYPFDMSTQYVYVSGKSSAVGSTRVAEDCVVGIGKGYITVKTTKDRRLYIYDVGGRLVKSLYVRADVSQRVSLSAGVYVVEDRKVVVN